MRKKWCVWVLMGGFLISMTSCASSSRSNRDFTVNRSYKKRTYANKSNTRNRSTKVEHPRSDGSRVEAEARKQTTSRSSDRVKAELLERGRLVDFAQSFKGKAYRYGGKTPETGFDCSGLVYYTFRHFNYGMVAGSSNQAKLGRRIPIKEASPGDLLFFGNNQRVSHVGIVSFHDGNELRMVHSSSSRGVIEEDILGSTYWKSRFLYATNVISDIDSAGKAGK